MIFKYILSKILCARFLKIIWYDSSPLKNLDLLNSSYIKNCERYNYANFDTDVNKSRLTLDAKVGMLICLITFFFFVEIANLTSQSIKCTKFHII